MLRQHEMGASTKRAAVAAASRRAGEVSIHADSALIWPHRLGSTGASDGRSRSSFATHKWYRERFGDYPADRKVIVPFII